MEGSSSRKFKSICVFYGPYLGKGSEYMSAANNFGVVLAAHGINLIYGRGNIGLLGCVASIAKLRGRTALAIILKAFPVRKVYSMTLGTEFYPVSLHKMIGNIFNNIDALITLPGGLGTIEEIFNIASCAQLCLHQKPL